MIGVCVLWLEFERCANVLLACDACGFGRGIAVCMLFWP